LDNKINLALVGFGRFGKKYYKNLNQNKYIKSVKIYRKKNTIQKKFHRFLKEEIEKNNFKGGIVATPTKTHYQISKEFIKNKIPIILEKPAGFKVIEVNKMIYLSKKYNSSVIVNHSDLFNVNLNNLLNKIKLVGKINFIEADFGKFDSTYKDRNYLPFYDWMPHPLAILFSISNFFLNPIVEYNNITKKQGSFFQDITVTLKSKKTKLVRINYSNKRKKKVRKIIIHGSKGSISYDGYNDKNNYIFIKKKIMIPKSKITPMQNAINSLYYISKNSNYYSDLNLSLKIQKILEKIKKKIKI